MKKKMNKKLVVLLVLVFILIAVGVGVIYLVMMSKGPKEVEITPIEMGTILTTESGNWELIWSDEFQGNTLDLTKWDYQIGNGAIYGVSDWGNNEEEYYTSDNVSVSEGFLKIEAKQEEMNGKSYTSGRIRTLGDPLGDGSGAESLFSKKYGKFEARIKMPAGDGLWPAFWLLPDPNDNEYGYWAASGEIDIMEARGRLTEETSGTLHYGQPWPNNKYSGGTFNMAEGESTEGFHVYSLEWEPGEIRWYVDGELFHTENSWYSRGEGQKVDYPFPAPFDEEFYILLNLAVGGNFDGGKIPSDEDFPAEMLIDYVRVYDLEGGYDETIKKPMIAVDEAGTEKYISEDMDYNYVQDQTFDSVNEEMLKIRDMDVLSSNWYFLALSEFSGTASLSKGEEDGYTYVSIDTIAKGNQTYSVQLIQHLPVVKGYVYELSFDAKAEEERTILSKLGGDDDNGWSTYAGQFEDTITTEWAHYTQIFQMFSTTDGSTRLEFNLGGDTGEFKIANISLKIVPEN